jgi:site-specific recombinase XerD
VWDHRGRVPAGKKGQVEVRVTHNRKSYHFGTGVKCHKSELVAGQIVNCAYAKELNERVSIIYTKVLACVNARLEKDGMIDTEEVRKTVWQLSEELSGDPTLLNWINEQIPKLDVKDKKHYKSLQNRLEQFGKIRRWQDATIENIVEFDSWLHSLRYKANKKNGAKAFGRLGDGLSDGTIYNYHKCFKALLRRADMFGKIERSPYDQLRGKFKRGDRENIEYLTEAEMQAIMNIQMSEDTMLSRSRDLFIFHMWTGLSYSDAQAFDISKYKNVNDRWIYVGERIKTGVPYVSTLLPPVVEVLSRNDWSTPKIENHVYNRMLKAIGEMAGIKTKLHSHLARHSFATYMLNNGVPIEHVSKMVGHTNIMQTQRYAKVLAQSIQDDFVTIEGKLTKKPE